MSRAEGLSQNRDVLREIAFLDEGTRPDDLDQLAFGDQPTVVPHQYEQQIEGFGRKKDRLSVSQKKVFPRIEPKRTEFINGFRLEGDRGVI